MMNSRFATAGLGVVLLAVVATAGCGGGAGGPTPTSGSSTQATATSPDTAGPAITIKDRAFGNPLTVAPGATVKVTNQDSSLHNVTASADGGFKTKNLGKGESDTFTAPTKPGSYPFTCTIHPDMKGTLIVAA